MGMFSIFSRSNTFYFPGCVAYFKEKDKFELYKKIFSKLGISHGVISEKVCCGLPALEAGYETDARKLARRNLEIFKEKKINKLITLCPGCYKMLSEDYKKMLPDWNINIENIWKIILDRLSEKPLLIKNKANESVTIQDSCYLGRYCGIYDEPRKILELIGYEIKEMRDSKENAFCCGSCGGLPRVNPELADKIAKERLMQARRIGIKKMIVFSLDDYRLLKKNSEGTGIEILNFPELLGDALGLRKKEDNPAVVEKIVDIESTKKEEIEK